MLTMSTSMCRANSTKFLWDGIDAEGHQVAPMSWAGANRSRFANWCVWGEDHAARQLDSAKNVEHMLLTIQCEVHHRYRSRCNHSRCKHHHLGGHVGG